MVTVSARVRRRISVGLPGVPGRAPGVRGHPRVDRVVRLVQAVVRSAVDGDDSITGGRVGREHLARGVEGASDFNPEVAQQLGAGFLRVTVEKMLWPPDQSPGWPRRKSQTLPTAGPHADPTSPGGTLHRTAANVRPLTACTWTDTTISGS